MSTCELAERGGSEHDLARTLDHATVDGSAGSPTLDGSMPQQRDVRPVDVLRAEERAAPRFDVVVRPTSTASVVGRDSCCRSRSRRRARHPSSSRTSAGLATRCCMLAPKVTAAMSAVEGDGRARHHRARPTRRSHPLPGATAKRRSDRRRRRQLRRAERTAAAALPSPTSRGGQRPVRCSPPRDDADRPRASRPTATATPDAEHRPVGVEPGSRPRLAAPGRSASAGDASNATTDREQRADDHRDRGADRPTRRRSGSGRRRALARLPRSSRSAADVPAERLADEDEAGEPGDDPERCRGRATPAGSPAARGTCRST